MLGPIFSIEMLTSVRRGRFYVVRVLYAAVLFFALFTTYSFAPSSGNVSAINQSANVAGNFFYSFATLQILAVLMLGPAMASNTIAIERERRTIEYLFATDLTNREIVIGKLVARLLYIACMVLVGLPILSLAMLMGGIAPEQLAAVFLITLSTMVFVAVLAVTVSVWSQRVREAFTKVYLVLFALLIVPGAMVQPMANALGYGHIVAPVLEPLIAGNPFTALAALSFSGAASLQAQFGGFWQPVWDLMWVQGIASVGMGILATWAVRRVHLKSSGTAPRKSRIRTFGGRRPELGRYPMIWKERLTTRPTGRLGIVGRVAFLLIALGLLIPTIYWFVTTPGKEGAYAVTTMANLVACLGLLVVAGRAAVTITSEKEKDTWLSLIATPLTGTEIITGKLIGSLYAMRGLGLALVILWALQILKEPQMIFSLPFTVGTLAIIGFFASVLGLLCSMRCKSSNRAIGATLLSSLFVAGGYLIFGLPFFFIRFLGEFILAPCVPFLVYFPGSFALEWPAGRALGGHLLEIIATYLIGCIGYAAAGWALYRWITNTFDKRVGRMPEKRA